MGWRNWSDINQQIANCKRIPDRDEALKCLINLYQSTGDGMVANAIGEEYEARELLDEAKHWYTEAYNKFPLPQYKQRALANIERITSKHQSRKTAGEIQQSSLVDLSSLQPSETLLIVACSRTKIWQINPEAPRYVPARYAYCGKNFKKFTRWIEDTEVETRGFRWLILSAKYGYLEPWQPISDYDVTFNDSQTGPVSDETLYNQVMFQTRWRDQKPLKDFRHVLFFGSSIYAEKIRKSFKDLSVVIAPLEL